MDINTAFKDNLIHQLSIQSPAKLFGIVLGLALILGVGTGYILASTSGNQGSTGVSQNTVPTSASQDSKTFRDFAVGKIAKKPAPSSGDYSEGTHLLIRDGAVPVALTSSVVDLDQYIGKNVKVFGETQKALKEGWLMDVGKVEPQ